MLPLDRIGELLRTAHGDERTFPATIFYNEGWLLRLAIDWFSRTKAPDHALSVSNGSRWFSEALLPSQFLGDRRGDPHAEGWTHADAVIGHVTIGSTALANVALVGGASQFVVVEAKLFSPLSKGVRNARYFDQAARNVCCMAQVLSQSSVRPDRFRALGFYVIAPSEQVGRNLFASEMSKSSIQSKVSQRISEFPSPRREEKARWYEEWFLPTLARIEIECLTWEDALNWINSRDETFGVGLSAFYTDCIRFNRAQEPELDSST
jgi:hypothetical protein